MIQAAAMASLCLLLLATGTAYWDTNDDAGMLMAIEGIGMAASSSHMIVNSSILWGVICSIMPDFFGISGYTWAGYAAIYAALIAIAYCLRCAQTDTVTGTLLLLLPAASLLLFPQFSKTAGFVTLAGICMLHAYRLRPTSPHLIAALALLFLGFVIRDWAFVVVVAVCLPFLPWGLLKKPKVIISVTALALSIAGVFVLGLAAYGNNDWQTFTALNPVRAAFTDFKAMERLILEPALAAELGYSLNDIVLAGNWFFVDPVLAAPTRLQALLNALGPAAPEINNIRSGIAAITHVLYTLPLLATAFIILLTRLSRPTMIAWILLIALAALLGYLGRPAPPRVLIPLYAALMLLPFLLTDNGTANRSRRFVLMSVLIVANALHLYVLKFSQNELDKRAAGLPELMTQIERSPTYIWGDMLSTEVLYRPFERLENNRHYDYASLGQLTLAPFSRHWVYEAQGHGFMHRLNHEGVRIFAFDIYFQVLNVYCAERGLGGLEVIDSP